MPYNPGVQDISGQIRAQGILGAANSYGSGMQAISQGIQQRKLKDEQDAAVLAKAKSTESFIKAHADKFGGEEAVKQMLSVNPQETPLARYNRTATIMADTVTGLKMDADQQQAAQAKQQMAAQAFVLQQQKQRADQDMMQRKRFEQMMSAVGGAGGPPPGPIGPNTPAIAPPPTDPAMADALKYYQATGQVPDHNAMTQIMGQNSREDVARALAKAATERADDRLASREEIAAAQEATKRAKLDANSGPARYDTDPESNIRSIWSGAQWVPLPGQVAKDPYFAEIDKLVKTGTLTAQEAAIAKKKLIAHRGTFAPNGMQALTQAAAAASGNQQAPSASMEDFYKDSSVSSYKSASDLIAAVRAGRLSPDEAKNIAKQNGWK